MNTHYSLRATPEELSALPILKGLSEAQIRDLCLITHKQQVKKHDIIFSMGAPAIRFYHIEQGLVKILRLTASGREKVLNIAQPGQMFAEAAYFLPQKTYPASAIALQDSTLIAFDTSGFIEFLGQSSELAFHIITNLSIKLKGFVTQVESLSMENASLRVMNFIQNEIQSNPQQPPGNNSLELSMPRQTLASQLSMTPETLSRTLRQLQDQNIIQVKGKRIFVPNLHTPQSKS